MTNKKALSFGLFSKSSFFPVKKLIALFIFISLSVNGFAPSAAEASKYSFVMLAATVAQNAVMQIFKKCDASLSSIANDFYLNFAKVLDATSINDKSKSENTQGRENSPARNVDSKGIKQVTFNAKIKILKDEILFFSAFDGVLFNNFGANAATANNFLFSGIIILFLMFIAAILKRKELENNDIKNINIIRTEISA